MYELGILSKQHNVITGFLKIFQVLQESTRETQTHSMVISYAYLYAILGMKLCYNELFEVYEDRSDKRCHVFVKICHSV
jgi:hypothetical protein